MNDLTDPAGIVALAAGGVALVALVLAVVLAVKLRRLRAAQRGGARRERPRRPRRPRRRAAGRRSRRCTTASRRSPSGSTSAWRAAEQRLDGAIAYRALVRYDAYGELSGHQSTSIALLDAERNGVVLSCDRPPRHGAAVLQAGARRRAASSSCRPRRPRRSGSRSPASAVAHRDARLMRVGLPRPARARSATRRCRAGAGGAGAASRSRRSTTPSLAVHDGDGRPRARADRELARGLGERRRSTRSRRDRRRGIVGELRPPGAPLPDRARAGRARRRRDGRLASRRRAPSARASCASSCRGAPVVAGALDRRRGAPGRRRASAAARGARHAPRGRALRLRRCCARRRGRRRQRDPLRLARAAPGPSRRRRRRRALEDRAGLLGRRRSSGPGWLVRCLSEFASAASTSPGSSRGRARSGLGEYMFFVDLDGAARATPRSPRRSRGCARHAESCACSGRFQRRLSRPAVDAATLRVSDASSVPPVHHWGPCRATTTSGTDRTRRHWPLVWWSCARPQRDVRADQRLHGPPRDGAAAQGEGRGARARRDRAALGDRLAAAAGRDPARHLRPRAARHATGARSPAARCSRATAGSASTAARARA